MRWLFAPLRRIMTGLSDTCKAPNQRSGGPLLHWSIRQCGRIMSCGKGTHTPCVVPPRSMLVKPSNSRCTDFLPMPFDHLALAADYSLSLSSNLPKSIRGHPDNKGRTVGIVLALSADHDKPDPLGKFARPNRRLHGGKLETAQIHSQAAKHSTHNHHRPASSVDNECRERHRFSCRKRISEQPGPIASGGSGKACNSGAIV